MINYCIADALKRAYQLHLRNEEKVLIVQINASGMIQCQSISSSGHLLPIWKSNRRGGEEWLSLAEVRTILGIQPQHTHKSVWLARGHILSSRFVAAWPVIGDELFFNQERSENLIDLFTLYCGHEPDFTHHHQDSGRYLYDWDIGAFVETDWWKRQHAGDRFLSVRPVMAATRLQYPRLAWYGYAGFLRGMIVID